MKPKGRQMMAWLLTAAVTLSGNSFTVLADEMDVQVQQETSENEEIFATEEAEPVQDEAVDTEDSAEISFDEETQDEIQIEDAEGSDSESEEELQIEEDYDESENPILGGLDDVSVFSSEEDTQDPEEYKIWFENLRDDEYSTYFFDNENGELRLNTENLNGKNASISWEVGYRLDDQDGSREDEFTTETGLPEDMIFWSDNADNNSVLEIKGAKLQEASRWLSANKGNEYWFEVRAYVNIAGEDEPVYLEQAGLYSREHVEDYHLPDDEVLLTDWNYWVGRYNYNCYVENAEHLRGDNVPLELTDISVANAEDEEDETLVCEIESTEADGWNIRAKRLGTAIVTLTYKDISGEEQPHSFKIYVNGDKFTLEPQWPASGSCMLKNSEMTISFVLHHNWKNSDEDQGSEDMTGWTLELDLDEDGYAYDTNLLDVEVHGEEHTITIRSKDNTWGTGMALRALHPSEDESEETTYSYVNIPVQVCEEYDVLYPETIGNVDAGDVLDFNNCGLKVEHIKENEDPYTRDDVTYDFEYDTDQWTDEAAEGQLPILRRKTADGTQINVIARDENGGEIRRREYWFDNLDYSIWFEDLKEGDYSTYFFNDENGELKLNTENLNDRNASVSWEVGYRTNDENGEDDEFTSDMELPENMIFWSETDDNNILEINGEKLWDAYKWLEENTEGDFWFEARASVKVGEETVYMVQAGINTRETREDYYLPTDEVLLKDESRFINREFNCHVENAESPDGDDLTLKFTALYIENEENDEDETLVCEIENQDENGWNIIARRYGTAVVTLEYENLSGEPQEYSFRYYVKSDRYTLEPQWGASEGNMLRNSEMELGFVLYHDWRNDDDEQYGVEVEDWELAFVPDENDWSYDTNLLKDVTIKDGKTLVIKSGEETWGTDISLKAMISAEDDKTEDVTFDQVHIEVREEYDILYPTDIANLNVGEILDPEENLEVIRITDDGKKKIEVDHYDVEYDSNQWDAEEREGRLPLLKRKTADNCWLNIIARDEYDGEIRRREYEFDGLDYSVWFEDLRGDSGDFTFAFEDEQYELSLNTDNLVKRGVKDSAKIVWAVGYAYTDENEEVIQKNDIPNEYTFWSENPQDNSKLIIDSSKLTKAYDWLHTQTSGDCWFEIHASVEIGGEIVFEEAYTGLSEVYRNEEEYYISFGATLNMVPGDTFWLDDYLEGYIRDKDHPDGEEIRAEITRVSVDDTTCCSVAYQGNGWSVKALKCGRATLELIYTDYHGKQQKGEFILAVQDEAYWMNYNLERSEMLPGEEKKFTISVYRATKDNLDGEVVDPTENKYSVTVEKRNQDDPIEVTADVDGKITIKVNENAEPEQSYGFYISVKSEAKDEEGKPRWAVKGDVYVYVMERYPDKIQLNKDVELDPAIGDTFNINEYKPTLLRYNAETDADDKWEELKIDNKSFRFVLEWDESVWTAQDKNSLPVLKRTGASRGAIRLIAQEYNQGSNEWYNIAEDSYYVSTIFDKDAKCSHIWETIIDEKGNCGKAEKRHRICTACQKTEQLPDIPATGKHQMSGWKVTKQATALAAGMKEQTCTECGLKQQQSIPKLAATLTLNVPVNKTLPMKMKQTYQLKVSGLAKGDKVVSWTSSNKKIATVSGSGKLKALKKAGKTTITVKLASGKTAKFTVKVQKADVATTSLTVMNKATGKKMPKTVSLKAKKKLALTATVAPVTSKQKVTYSTSDKSIATVNAKGVITAKKKGTVTITVKSGKKKVTVKVKVTK